ncbi:hypothetical protein [Lusitaniella coriacea]|uniref:hypothetical protein n=1 Tax=Lusitaniella coriacea TaxID=1983105 RepID=UPI003CED329B
MNVFAYRDREILILFIQNLAQIPLYKLFRCHAIDFLQGFDDWYKRITLPRDRASL